MLVSTYASVASSKTSMVSWRRASGAGEQCRSPGEVKRTCNVDVCYTVFVVTPSKMLTHIEKDFFLQRVDVLMNSLRPLVSDKDILLRALSLGFGRDPL